MGRMLNPKKKKMLSPKQRKELQEQGVNVSYDRSDYIAAPVKGPRERPSDIFETMIAESSIPIVEEPPVVEEPPSEEPKWYLGELPKSIEEILQRIKDEGSPGRCNDLWKEGDW